MVLPGGELRKVAVSDIALMKDSRGKPSIFDYERISAALHTVENNRDFGRAVKLCDILLMTMPDNIDIYHLRALAENLSGDREDAVKDFEKLYARNVRDPGIVTMLGAEKAAAGQARDAEALFVEAMRPGENNVMLHKNLALLLMEQGDMTSARQHYQAVIDSQEDFDAYYNLAAIYARLKNYRRASSLMKHACSLRPEDEEAMRLYKALEKHE